MASLDETTLIVITAPGGSIISINHNKNTKVKGDQIKPYLDTVISEAGYDLCFVTSFVDYSGESRIQYTLIKRSNSKGTDSV